jgi:hypothetical protein
MNAEMTLVEFMRALGRNADDWWPWYVVAKVIDGATLNEEELRFFVQCTGRDKPPADVREFFGVIGRRGRKTAFMALVACWVAFCGRFKKAPGEIQQVLYVALVLDQGAQFMSYVREIIKMPRLAAKVLRSTSTAIYLRNGREITTAANSFRTLRGATCICAIFDELALWYSEDSRNPDREVYRAVRPAMLTARGALLLGMSSPYDRTGLLWDKYDKLFGKDGTTLVWKAPTLDMNPGIDDDGVAAEITAEYAKDPLDAAAAYGAEFRNPNDAYISRDMIEGCVVKELKKVPWESGGRYFAFCDAATGAGKDSFTLAIAAKVNDGADLVFLFERAPPFSRDTAIADCASFLRQYRLNSVTGDRFAKGFVADVFQANGIQYIESTRTRSDIYLDALASINSGRYKLLDSDRLVAQISGLVRKPGRCGNDSIDHARGQHDDLANAACGALVLADEGSGGSQHYGWTELSHGDGVSAAIANMGYWERYQLQQLGMYGHASYGAGRPWWE